MLRSRDEWIRPASAVAVMRCREQSCSDRDRNFVVPGPLNRYYPRKGRSGSVVVQNRGPSLLEICVQDIESCLACAEGGADRVELCADLVVGGVTPGVGSIALACRRLAIPVH